MLTGENRERVKGVFNALSSVVDETLHMGALQVLTTETHCITAREILSEEAFPGERHALSGAGKEDAK
ncbi:uncharacterized protein NEMAJ01_0506 [Nematocida major]|uniref:uncharacterized protein n=1 Tax=Nematocida major TaxID=1912982 RepID=UPI002008BE52|nr:uncharacterized protein NEMAJ01_0506 [Nematocida major]KAH9385610.1 hypothetical protein NEMAJ01_0506 [Nematocida major]